MSQGYPFLALFQGGAKDAPVSGTPRPYDVLVKDSHDMSQFWSPFLFD